MDPFLQTFNSPATFPASPSEFNFADDAAEFTYQQDMRRWRNDALGRIDSMALEPAVAFKDADFSMASDPARVQRMATNSAFLEVFDGAAVADEESDPVRQMVRATVARRLFEGRGAESEEAFHNEVKNFAQGRKDRKTLATDLLGAASLKAFQTREDLGYGGKEYEETTFRSWKETAKTKPGYDPSQEADYFELWHQKQAQVKELVDPFRTELDGVWRAFVRKEDYGTAAENAYFGISEKDRPAFMAALSLRAKALPEAEQATFWGNLWGNLKKQSGRDVKGFGQSIVDGLQMFTAGTAAANAMDNASIVAQADMERRAIDFRADVVRVQQRDYDPMKYLAADDSWAQVFEKGAYGAPGAVATSLAAAVPGVGLTAFYVSSQESIYQQFRQDFQDKGLSYDQSRKYANDLAPVAAFPQVLMEKLQIDALRGKLPVLDGVLNGMTDKITSRVLRYGVRVGAGAIEEGTLEKAQDLVPSLVQDIGHALESDIPDVQWTGKGGVLDGFWKDNVQMMVTMLPLAIFGAAGGVSSERRVHAFKSASDLELEALGGKKADIPALRKELEKGYDSGAAAIEKFMESSDATTPEAKAAVEQLKVEHETSRQAQEALERLGYAAPRFVQSADGITVFDGQSGEELGQAPDLSGAVRIARAHTVALDDLDADQVAALGSLVEAARAATELDPQSVQDLSFGGTFDPSKASSEMAARYADQVALKEQAEGGTGDIARSVLGYSVTEFARGMRTTINKLFRGASVTDVFHETFHGLRRQARAAGTITREDEIALLRSLDTILAGKTTKGGTQLRFIPEGMADEAIPETLLDEAFSEIGEMEVLRTRKGAGKGKLGVSRAVVSRNISALARLMPGVVGKWQAFMNAVRARWGLSLSRTVVMKKAGRDGTFDQDGYDAFLDKVLGLDHQNEHDVGVQSEFDRILGLPGDLAGDDIPFSIGPVDVAGIMEGNALARITDPRRRTQVMSRIARDYNAMRLQIERIASLRGIKRSKSDLRQEANAREDLAAEEKIAAIHERYGQLLADEDLVKIKSQPIHQHLADPTSPLRGRLMSKAAAIKAHPDMFQLHRAGEYDGSDGISRSVFGGSLMPDQAAQELYDHGLIKEPTADAMWEALMVEQKTVAGFKEMLAKAQGEIRAAKLEAKREANEWLATQSKDQEVNFSGKEEIRRSLRMLDAILLALPPEIRGRIGGYTQISMIATDEARLAYLQNKLAKADKELETFLRIEYAKEWEALLKRAAPKTNAAGERPTGSIAADAYDIITMAESAMGMSFVDGEAKATELDAKADDERTSEKDADKFRMMAQMVRLTMNWPAADAARREQAVLEGEKIYYGGLSSLAIENSRRRERLGILRKSAIAGTGKTGHRMEREKADHEARATDTGKIKQWGWDLLSFGQVVDVLFGEDSAAAKWFNSRELAASNALEDGFQAKANGLEALFDTLARSRFSGIDLRHKMATEKSIKVKDALGIEHTFTQSQAITFLLMWRQEDGRRHMEGIKDDETQSVVSSWAWDDRSAAEVESQLSDQGRAAMAFLGQSYGEEYDRINAVFRRIWNVSMPRHKMYAPLTVTPVQSKGDNITDPTTGDTMGIGMTPGSLKNRSFSAIAEPEFKDAFQVYLTHARQMEHFIAYGEFARDALAIINRRETRNAIKAAGGPYGAEILSKWVDFFALGGVQGTKAGGALWESIGNAIGRLSSAALVGRVSVLAMQSLQLGAAAFKMPTGAFLIRFAKLFTGQLNWWVGPDSVLHSPYIERRLAESPPAVRDMMRGIAAGTPNRAKYYAAMAGRSIAHADAFFTAGTYAILYDYHLAQAKTQKVADPEAEAHRQAELLTDQVAQPQRAGARSWLEISTQGDPAFRAAWNFSTDPRQKFALLIYQMMRRDTSGWDKAAHAGKTAVLLWSVSGVLASVLRASLRDSRDDDDKEVFDERHWSLYRLALMASTGPFSGIPLVGDMIEDSTYKATGQYLPSGGLFNALGDAWALPRKWSKGKVDPLKDIETIATAAATRSNTAAAATNLMHLIRDVWGISDNFTDWD